MNGLVATTKCLGKKGIAIAMTLLLTLTLFTAPVLAQGSKKDPFSLGMDTGESLGSNIHVAQANTLKDTVISLVNNIFLLVGFLAVLFIIYAGIRLIVSRGNEEAMKNATKTLTYAVVGFMLILFSYIIVRFITELLLQSSGDITTDEEFDPTA